MHITNVRVLDNPASFLNPFQFEITFECAEDLSEDLEWKIIYVGSAETEDYDQTLDTVLVGPVSAGRHMFVFQAGPPDQTLIPENDVLGVTVVLITCSFRNQEFVRVGYYVNNEYEDSLLQEKPPSTVEFSKVVRNILDSKPRVTRFTIDWDQTGDATSVNNENVPPPSSNLPNQQCVGASTSGIGVDTAASKFIHEAATSMNTDSNGSIPDYTAVEMEH